MVKYVSAHIFLPKALPTSMKQFQINQLINSPKMAQDGILGGVKNTFLPPFRLLYIAPKLLHQLSSDAVQEWQLAHITRRHKTVWAVGERQRCASVQLAKRVVLGLTGLPNIWKTVGRGHKSDFQSKHCYTLCLNRYVHLLDLADISYIIQSPTLIVSYGSMH